MNTKQVKKLTQLASHSLAKQLGGLAEKVKDMEFFNLGARNLDLLVLKLISPRDWKTMEIFLDNIEKPGS